MLDIKNYKEKKEKGLVCLVKAGDSFAIATKKFDPETGADLPDEVVGVNMQELQDRQKSLQEEITEISSFIKDCEALNI